MYATESCDELHTVYFQRSLKYHFSLIFVYLSIQKQIDKYDRKSKYPEENSTVKWELKNFYWGNPVLCRTRHLLDRKHSYFSLSHSRSRRKCYFFACRMWLWGKRAAIHGLIASLFLILSPSKWDSMLLRAFFFYD